MPGEELLPKVEDNGPNVWMAVQSEVSKSWKEIP